MLPCVRWLGRAPAGGGLPGGRIADMKSNYVLIKNISVIGASRVWLWDPVKGVALKAIDVLASQGVLKPHISARFPLEEGVQALRLMAEGGATGKIVVTM